MSANGGRPRELRDRTLGRLHTMEHAAACEYERATEGLGNRLTALRRELPERRQARGGRPATPEERDADARLRAEIDDLEGVLVARAEEQERLDGVAAIGRREVEPDVLAEARHLVRCGAGDAALQIRVGFAGIARGMAAVAEWALVSDVDGRGPAVGSWGGRVEAMLDEASRRIEQVIGGLPRTGDPQPEPIVPEPPRLACCRALVDLDGRMATGERLVIHAGALCSLPLDLARAHVEAGRVVVHAGHVERDFCKSRDEWRAARNLPKLPPDPPVEDRYSIGAIQARASERAQEGARERMGGLDRMRRMLGVP